MENIYAIYQGDDFDFMGTADKWEQSKPAYEPVEETEIDSDSLPF